MSKRHWLVIALLLSVAVNLLVLGVVLGRGSMHSKGAPPIAWAAETLPPATRRLVRQQMRRQLPQVRPLRGELQQAMQAVQRAAVAEDFKPEALSAALERWRQASQRYQAFIHSNLVDLSADLSPSERKALLRGAMLRATSPERALRTRRQSP